jgi:D-sedoheptulose 7-phosphate isomerase
MTTPPGAYAAAVATSLKEAADLLAWLRDNEQVQERIATLGRVLADCLERGNRILTCGNGGSMCDAMHMAQELSGHFRGRRRALAAQSISDPSHLTCAANDEGFERVFARGVEAWGTAGDTLVAFSTSGNSANVVAAVDTAREKGLFVVGLLGREGGKLVSRCDSAIVVPGTTSDRIQEIHIKIVHLLIEQVELQMFGSA